jgi:hypothetical protein
MESKTTDANIDTTRRKCSAPSIPEFLEATHGR